MIAVCMRCLTTANLQDEDTDSVLKGEDQADETLNEELQDSGELPLEVEDDLGGSQCLDIEWEEDVEQGEEDEIEDDDEEDEEDDDDEEEFSVIDRVASEEYLELVVNFFAKAAEYLIQQHVVSIFLCVVFL